LIRRGGKDLKQKTQGRKRTIHPKSEATETYLFGRITTSTISAGTVQRKRRIRGGLVLTVRPPGISGKKRCLCHHRKEGKKGPLNPNP